MSFDVSPLARSLAASSVDRPRRPAARSEASFANPALEAATPPIPREVLDQVDAAARLAEDLQARGRGVRFDVHKLDGGVVAALVDDQGGMLRPLLLSDVVDVSRLAGEVGKDVS